MLYIFAVYSEVVVIIYLFSTSISILTILSLVTKSKTFDPESIAINLLLF